MDPAVRIEVAAMSNARALDEAVARGDSDIQRFYSRCTLLVTGGTGFMGKQLLEKIFRSCDISKVYLLLRPKKGKDTQERITEMLQDPVFDRVRSLKPDFAHQIFAIEGDVAALRLGISDQDWETLIKEVNVIYHMAATTRFDENLRVATLINVRGTREALLLGRACQNLKSFVHVSTAYTQATSSLAEQQVFEKFQPSPIPPQALIAMAECVDGARLDSITPMLIQDWPNTYTFTKAVAEELVRTLTAGMPVCIIRPGIVQAAYKEPCPGWVDMSCAYGASGILLGTGLGVLHTMLANTNVKGGVVPCDYANNAIIVSGSEAKHSNGGESTTVYTVSSVARNTLRSGRINQVFRRDKKLLCSPKSLYFAFIFETTSPFLFMLQTLFLHFLPAYAADFILLLLGKERRAVKLYKKIYKMQKAVCYFSMNSWIFDDKNLEGLFNSLSKTDKKIFNFDMTTINWDEYIRIWVIGIRKYILKDGLRDTEWAYKKQMYLMILHYILTILFVFLIWKVFCGAFFVCERVMSLLQDVPTY